MSLFESINLIYGTISEFCIASVCPDMSGPGQRIYMWFDERGKKTKVSAPQYIDYVMTFIQKTISDEAIFPTKYDKEFPVSFESIVRKIVRLLFHVLSHVYACHFRQVAQLGLHSHLNLIFAHIIALQNRFSLLDAKETEGLRDLELALKLSPHLQSQTCSANAANSLSVNNNNHVVTFHSLAEVDVGGSSANSNSGMVRSSGNGNSNSNGNKRGSNSSRNFNVQNPNYLFCSSSSSTLPSSSSASNCNQILKAEKT